MRTRAVQNHVVAGLASLMILSACEGDKVAVKPASTMMDPVPVAVPPIDGQPDSLATSQWAVAKLGLPQIWGTEGGRGSRRITVAVVSTGVDYNHEDLRANILVNDREATFKKPVSDPNASPADDIDDDQNGFADDVVGWDAVDNDGFPYDAVGSGTAAAGVIGAVHANGTGVQGINPQVSLIPVRYISSNGQANIPRLVKALRYVAAVNVDVVYLHLANLEFGKGALPSYRAQVAKAEQKSLEEALAKVQHLPIVVSAGNTGPDGTYHATPVLAMLAQMQNVIVVTSVNESDRLPVVVNRGRGVVDAAAPGIGVLSTLPGNQYGTVSGTSVAAAHVAGAVALAMGKHYGRHDLLNKIRESLISRAGGDPLPESSMVLSGSRLNIARFMGELDKNLR